MLEIPIGRISLFKYRCRVAGYSTINTQKNCPVYDVSENGIAKSGYPLNKRILRVTGIYGAGQRQRPPAIEGTTVGQRSSFTAYLAKYAHEIAAQDLLYVLVAVIPGQQLAGDIGHHGTIGQFTG